MKHLKDQWLFALGLMIISVLFYLLHYYLFHDPHHLFVFLVEDIAFVFIEVLLVTLIIHRVLETREKQTRMKKMNMVIGVFFSELGDNLLKHASIWDNNIEYIQQSLNVNGQWQEKDFNQSRKQFMQYKPNINPNSIHWIQLKKTMSAKREFLIRLLENPNLLEHESFTDLLQAVFHLIQELEARNDFTKLPDNDANHLTGDIMRVYTNLIIQWLDYLEHLKTEYPYLFSLAIRMNPFSKNISATIY